MLPAGIWALWRVQTLTVEALRRVLLRLVRWQRWMYSIVSWFGTFLHEVSHASVLLLSGHGIREFRAGVEEGHVLPARIQRGPLGFLFFLAAALAPLFVPPALVLGGAVLFLDRGLVPWSSSGPGLDATLGVGADFLLSFPRQLAWTFADLDLAQPSHALLLALALLGIPGSRPSHVKGSRFHGTKDEGDIAVLRSRIRRNPWPLLAFLGILYGAYFPLTRWAPDAYWFPLEAVVAVALTGILLALLGIAWWGLASVDGRVRPWAGWLGPALFFAVEYALRQPWGTPGDGVETPLWTVNAIALGAWAAGSATLRILLPRREARFG